MLTKCTCHSTDKNNARTMGSKHILINSSMGMSKCDQSSGGIYDQLSFEKEKEEKDKKETG